MSCACVLASAQRGLPQVPHPVVHAASACAAPFQLVSARAKKPESRSELPCRLQPAGCQHEQPRPECPRSPPRQARCPTMSAGGRCRAGWEWGPRRCQAFVRASPLRLALRPLTAGARMRRAVLGAGRASGRASPRLLAPKWVGASLLSSPLTGNLRQKGESTT